MTATGITLGVYSEFDIASVDADGSECRECGQPMFGKMAAVRVFIAVGRAPVPEDPEAVFPICCPSCAGDERMMRLPCHPDGFI